MRVIYIYIKFEKLSFCVLVVRPDWEDKKTIAYLSKSVCPLMTTATILSFICWNLTHSPHCSLILCHIIENISAISPQQKNYNLSQEYSHMYCTMTKWKLWAVAELGGWQGGRRLQRKIVSQLFSSIN